MVTKRNQENDSERSRFYRKLINNYPKNAWTTSRRVNFLWVANFNLKFGLQLTSKSTKTIQVFSYTKN